MEAEKTGPEPHTSTAACGNLARAAILTAGRSELAAGSASGSSPTLRQRGSSRRAGARADGEAVSRPVRRYRRHLIPKDVSVSLTARLPANLDATDWQMLIETLDAIKQCLPDAGQRQPGEVMRYVLEAIRVANAPTIEG
jgi:hypothetical protein